MRRDISLLCKVRILTKGWSAEFKISLTQIFLVGYSIVSLDGVLIMKLFEIVIKINIACKYKYFLG